MTMFTLAISFLTTSNLPWFMDLTFQFLWNITSHVTSTTGFVFALASFLLLSNSILGTYSCVCVCVCVCVSVCVCVCVLGHVWLFATPWTIARQSPLSMEFSRQEYWNGLPFSSPGDLLNPGIEPESPALKADSSLSGPPGKTSSFLNPV